MDSARWQEVEALFHQAADLKEPERSAFLCEKCKDDEALLAEVLSLLQEDQPSSTLLDKNLAEVAERILNSKDSTHPGPRELGPYLVERVLGEGGMGVVYLAAREDIGSQVAIKVLRDAWLSPARRERFASEQRTLAQLNHPGIARLYDADSLADGTPWFAMEYVEGERLTEYCARHKSTIPERLKLFREICEAVQYAHRHAVIHRDLKPSNILVKEDGSARLLDFGISKHLESLDMAAEQTMTGLRLMTPAYAAPEQIRGERVGIHSDVYSLGVILYELLTGRLPFDFTSCSPREAEALVEKSEPVKPSVLVKHAGEHSQIPIAARQYGRQAWSDLDVLCLTAMHKDPQRRYASVEALVRDVDHFLKSEPLEARPDSLRYRLSKFVGRNRVAVYSTAAVTFLVLALVIFFTVRLARARNAALSEAARTLRIQKFMQNLFSGGDEVAGPADNLRVVALLDRGVLEARGLDSEPQVQADLYQTLGNLYQRLGKVDQADSLFRSALEKRKSLYGPDSAPVADTLVATALLRADQAQLEEAEKLARDGLAMSQRHYPVSHPAVAKATTALGQILENRGSYDAAIQLLETSVKSQSTSGSADSPELTDSLYELANAHFYAGHYDQSKQLNEKVLELHRKQYGENHPAVAEDLINLGAIQFDLGNYAEAEKFDRQALAITRAFYGEQSPNTATHLTMLARALVRQTRYEEAAPLLHQALAIQESAYGPSHPRVASALNEAGSLALQTKNYSEAESDFSRMEAIYRSVYGDNHYLIAIAQSNRASVYLGREEWKRAEELYREVVRRFMETLSAKHINTGIARIKLGRAIVRQKRFAEAEVESRAGYEILSAQSSPSVSWLQTARKDLVEEYEALRTPEKAAQFRAELVAMDAKPAPSVKR